MDFSKQIRQKLGKLSPDACLVLVVAGAKDYSESTVQLLKYVNVEKKLPGIYVTVSKPYETIRKALESAGVNTKAILFIDAVSGSPAEENKSDGCIFIGSPQDLTGISIAISEAVKALPMKRRFLLFDSISALAIHNSAGSVAKFAHFLATNMRKWEIMGFIILLENETHQELVNELTQFCDLTLELGGGKR